MVKSPLYVGCIPVAFASELLKNSALRCGFSYKSSSCHMFFVADIKSHSFVCAVG